MNRLVIIGNGFDLAHGLKTSYQDFINWYWNQWVLLLKDSSKNKEYDTFCTFSMSERESNKAIPFYKMFDNYPYSPTMLLSDVKKYQFPCSLKYTSRLFKRINQSIATKGWVDIENEYYHLLVHDEERLSPYQVLNDHLDILRKKLIEYLQTVVNTEIPMIPDINDKIYRPIKREELSIKYSFYTEAELSLSNIMLLNFNYTKTPEMYLKGSTIINYIHGKLDNPEGVIFGYGDELDEDYKRLKNLNDNECLRHMKSIRYLDAGNYRNMLQFIEADSFQVCIMGHSCGNSDRTLLNTIFEHRNCASVKPYYYIKDNGEDNFSEITINISRNFNDMKLMRDRVVEKPYTEPLVSK